MLEVVGDRRRGVLIGATLVTPRAGEIVGELVLAIKLRTPSRKPSPTSSILSPRSTACSGPAWASSPARSRSTSPRESDHLDSHESRTVIMSSPQMAQVECRPPVRRNGRTSNSKSSSFPCPTSIGPKRFYESLGWRLDGDFTNGPDWRGVQMTPPGFGLLYSVRHEPQCRRRRRRARTCTWSCPQHGRSPCRAARARASRSASRSTSPASAARPCPVADPDGRSYSTYATFSDPDGNGWLLQEMTVAAARPRVQQPRRRDADGAAEGRRRRAMVTTIPHLAKAPLVRLVRRLRRCPRG